MGQLLSYLMKLRLYCLRPVNTIFPDFNWSILLLASTKTAELLLTYQQRDPTSRRMKPPIAVTALERMTNKQALLFEEYANSPAPSEPGAEMLSLRLILIVCAISYSCMSLKAPCPIVSESFELLAIMRNPIECPCRRFSIDL